MSDKRFPDAVLFESLPVGGLFRFPGGATTWVKISESSFRLEICCKLDDKMIYHVDSIFPTSVMPFPS